MRNISFNLSSIANNSSSVITDSQLTKCSFLESLRSAMKILQSRWNGEIATIFNAIDNSYSDVQPFVRGLSGSTLFVDSNAKSWHPYFWTSSANRPATIYESAVDLYAKREALAADVKTLQSLIAANDKTDFVNKFIELQDVPNTYVQGRYLRVNETAGKLEPVIAGSLVSRDDIGALKDVDNNLITNSGMLLGTDALASNVVPVCRQVGHLGTGFRTVSENDSITLVGCSTANPDIDLMARYILHRHTTNTNSILLCGHSQDTELVFKLGDVGSGRPGIDIAIHPDHTVGETLENSIITMDDSLTYLRLYYYKANSTYYAIGGNA